MIHSKTRPITNPFIPTSQNSQRYPIRPSNLIYSCHHHNPRLSSSPNATNNPINPRINLLKPFVFTPNQLPLNNTKFLKRNVKDIHFSQKGIQQMLLLCGFGFWVQGFRCFPWLALHFHMAHVLKLQPSTLQLMQNIVNFPMVAKPLYGVLSDAFYIGGAHRIPYISIGVVLQVLSWATLILIPVASEALPTLLACMLVSNLGASMAEVANDALIAEYAQKWKMKSLQSHVFMAQTAGAILGNLFAGYFLLKTQQPKFMYVLFTLFLFAQLSISSRTREDSLGLTGLPTHHVVTKSVSENLHEQFSNLGTAISEEKIFFPLCWVVASISMVPVLTGTTFCYQTQYLRLDASIIGMSKVIGQIVLLSAAVLYDRCWKKIPMRKFIRTVQIVYAVSLLLDLILVKQYNLRVGISNEVYVLCLSGLAETIAQFKLLPFTVLFAKLCPPGCEGSLTSFLASALCLSAIISGFLGVGLASLIGISAGNYSSLSSGIVLQFIAALVPLLSISFIPMYQSGDEKGIKSSRRSRWSKRSRIRLKQ